MLLRLELTLLFLDQSQELLQRPVAEVVAATGRAVLPWLVGVV